MYTTQKCSPSYVTIARCLDNTIITQCYIESSVSPQCQLLIFFWKSWSAHEVFYNIFLPARGPWASQRWLLWKVCSGVMNRLSKFKNAFRFSRTVCMKGSIAGCVKLIKMFGLCKVFVKIHFFLNEHSSHGNGVIHFHDMLKVITSLSEVCWLQVISINAWQSYRNIFIILLSSLWWHISIIVAFHICNF